MSITKISQTAFLLLVLCISFSLPAVAGIYQSSVLVGPSGGVAGDYVMFATTEPVFGGDTAALYLGIVPVPFQPNRPILHAVTTSLDPGNVWFKTVAGVVIDPVFAATATPFANAFTADVSGQFQMTQGQSFLMGFWLDANFDSTPDLGDRFGWARLSYTTASGLTLLDNAIEDTGTGIIAGTTTAPEPSASLLLAISLSLGLLCRTTRRRSAQACT